MKPATILSVRPIGVYRVPLDPAVLVEVIEVNEHMAPDDVEEMVREQYDGLRLVELIVEAKTGTIEMKSFRTAKELVENSQVPYLDRVLSAYGSDVLVEWIEELPDGPSRIAFFLHYMEDGSPLHTPVGIVTLPEPTTMPHRLTAIMAYEWP